jgi:hypothetical protein
MASADSNRAQILHDSNQSHSKTPSESPYPLRYRQIRHLRRDSPDGNTDSTKTTKPIRLPPPPFQTLTNGIRLALVKIRAFRQRVDAVMSPVCGRVQIRFYTRANCWSKIDVVDGALDWRSTLFFLACG